MIVRKRIFGFLLLDRAHVWIGLYLSPVKFHFCSEVLLPQESSFKGFILRIQVWILRTSPLESFKWELTFWRSFNPLMELPTKIPRLDLSFLSQSTDWGILLSRSFLIPSKVDTMWLSAWSIQWLHWKSSKISNKTFFNKVLFSQWSPISSTEICSPTKVFTPHV